MRRRPDVAIKRIWHGWTTPGNADVYQALLHDEVFPGIEALEIPGYRSMELLRRDLGDEVEFVTIMTFDSLQNVIDFQDEDYARSYVPDAAMRVLQRWEAVEAHYEAIERRVTSQAQNGP
jgi:antibiotic biosynthesis monooxygenase (ABM) superfamily enzyme